MQGPEAVTQSYPLGMWGPKVTIQNQEKKEGRKVASQAHSGLGDARNKLDEQPQKLRRTTEQSLSR